MPILLLLLAIGLAWSTPSHAQTRAPRATVEAFLGEPVFWKQSDIGEQLVKQGDRSVLAALEPWLTHDDRHVRANVAFVFAGLRDPRGLATLEEIVNDRTPRPWAQGWVRPPSNLSEGWQSRPSAQQTNADRYYAVHVIATLRATKALPTLLPLLGEPGLAYQAAWALGEIGDARATPALIEALRARDASTRLSAATALAKLRAVDAIPALLALEHDDAATSDGAPVLVSQRALEAVSYLRSLGPLSVSARTRSDLAPPSTVTFPTGDALIDKATRADCQIPGTWWCWMRCDERWPRQEVSIAPNVSALPPLSPVTVIVALGLDDAGRVRDACILRGARDDANRETIRALAKWRFTPASMRVGPLAGTPVWPIVVVTATIGSVDQRP